MLSLHKELKNELNQHKCNYAHANKHTHMYTHKILHTTHKKSRALLPEVREAATSQALKDGPCLLNGSLSRTSAKSQVPKSKRTSNKKKNYQNLFII